MNPLEDRLRELRALFVEGSQADLQALERACQEGDREELRRLAHVLAGNGGLFGFPNIRRAAEKLTDALDEEVDDERLREACGALVLEMCSVSEG